VSVRLAAPAAELGAGVDGAGAVEVNEAEVEVEEVAVVMSQDIVAGARRHHDLPGKIRAAPLALPSGHERA
jgi:hypothetical protein